MSMTAVEPSDEGFSLVVTPQWASAEIELERLHVGSSFRRGPLKLDHLEALVAADGNWPPLLVQRATCTVIDGRYRLEAARALGCRRVRVEWFDGDDAAALVEAVRRNVTHGLPLTLGERKAAASQLLQQQLSWSDARIGEACGLSPRTVARMRGALSAVDVDEQGRRLGRDGRYRPSRPGAARRRVAELLALDADASLRSIAARAGVSHETVRSVRKELQQERGDHPVGPVVLFAPVTTPPAAQWSEDSACRATDDRRAFATWFDAHALDRPGLAGLAASVPLSRVYEVIDESRRRAALWNEFADLLARRTR